MSNSTPLPEGDTEQPEISVTLTAAEALALSEMIRSVVRRRGRPLTSVAERLEGLAVYLRDQVPDRSTSRSVWQQAG